MSEHTHRYTGTGLTRADGPDVAHGDACTPSESELDAFGDCFEPLPDDDSDESDEPADEPADDVPSLSDARDILAANGIAYDEYRALQSAASEYDDVKGNLAATELQRELAAKLR